MRETNGRMVRMDQDGHGLWRVQEVSADGEGVLASFEDMESCVDYACGLEQRHEAVVVQVVH
ncbi:MAG: hypothetical protein JWP36_220 [Paucimonas sp.]|nr:hypothetical protein [Paucimonas sp.]